ncbi:MAG: DNA mismatch repair protein MutS [Opitutales bacterium]|nr:DNA mismatch repair protein MutS [Opitutales bacterium]
MAREEKVSPKRTPMLEQYWQFREKVPPNTLLLFRCGDFYEMFEDDAVRGSELLGITLTKRGGAPLAGIPYHAIDTYLSKALKVGIKIAICEQTETPRPGHLVNRALVRIITPGTTFEEAQLDSKSNNYILALNEDASGLSAAWADATTGEFFISTAKDKSQLLSLLTGLRPTEILIPEAWREGSVPAHLSPLLSWSMVTRLEDWKFGVLTGEEKVIRTLATNSLAGFGIASKHPALGPAGALIYYLSDMLCEQPKCLKKITEVRNGEVLFIDPASVRNLEIFRSAANTRSGSLLDAIDYTRTAEGARMLERWLAMPLRDLEQIRFRQNCVEEFFKMPSATGRIRDELAYVRDLPRILGRMKSVSKLPRDLAAIRESLRHVPQIKNELSHFSPSPLDRLLTNIDEHAELLHLLESALIDELAGTDKTVIREGYDEQLDEYRNAKSRINQWLNEYEQRLIRETGIGNLRLCFTSTFGWSIEVSKANKDKVPDYFDRRQTLVGAERYSTNELKAKEEENLHSEERYNQRSREIYDGIVEKIIAAADSLANTASALAQVDIFAGWAVLAETWNYCKPQLDDSGVLEIGQGRHPVVEQVLAGTGRLGQFVPNDTSLQADKVQIALITGPNMAGKSTYIRQVALIALLAQIGCYVPAQKARIGVADRIFCRVGASDELSRGNSTFMVEMNETANILNNATEKSLVILDEIGRGTSTYDGLSIAWSVVEYIHGNAEAGPRTLFATHYHELTRVASKLPRIKNYCVLVKEWNQEIVFVRQVIPGSIGRSYGIHVARLAGLPQKVIDRATEILAQLETQSTKINIEDENPVPAHEKPEEKNIDFVAEAPEAVLPPPPKKDNGQLFFNF